MVTNPEFLSIGPFSESLNGIAVAISTREARSRLREPWFDVYIKNVDRAELTFVTVPTSFLVRIWDAQGRELTDIAGWLEQVELINPLRRHWVTLAPGDVLRLTQEPLRPWRSPRDSGLRLGRGSYTVAVTLEHQRSYKTVQLPSPDDAGLPVWLPPEGADKVAPTTFEVR